MSDDPLLGSIQAAVAAAPDDAVLRVHLARLLLTAGRTAEATQQAAEVLTRDPRNADALTILVGQVAPAGPGMITTGSDEPAPARPAGDVLRQLDAEFTDLIPPQYVGDPGEDDLGSAFDVEQTGLRLADVGGMVEVKARLEASVLAPLRNPELGRIYGKSLRGGLLLYGPPGCGKTFIARAVAGEMGAKFISIALSDVLDMYIGQSERNLHQLFDQARRHAPCVIFLDEVDALGQKRSQRSGAARGSINQLLAEMDGADGSNDGVFVLGATNQPWDIDVALRRPGRFDRMLLVLPPDEPAREAILKYHLRNRPIAGIDARKIAKATDGYSGADLAYLCETATERALLDSARSGSVRMIGMADMTAALDQVRPSIGPWLDAARNVAQFANDNGSYDDLLAYLKRRRLL